MTKREFLTGAAAMGAAATMAVPAFSMTKLKLNGLDKAVGSDGKYVLPELTYPYNALEPYIDEQTMKLHHDIHHLGYVKGLNNATQKIREAADTGDFSLIKHWERELAFHGGGHFLHTIFWNVMGPKQGNRSNTLNSYIDKSFGSFDKFVKLYKAAAGSVEGSGWGILSYEPIADRLVIMQAEKQGNLTQWVQIPLLPVDVWEHAYYLKYQNKRGDYLEGFMNVVNWEYVSEQFDAVLSLYK
ncbi:MAG: superoxide dismutase [Candidatus Kapaibacterium sp.]